MDTWIRGFYLLAVIFGVGVTLVDLLGLLGNDSEGDADDVAGSAEALAHDASQSEGDAPDNVNGENGMATQSHVGDASSLLIVLKYLHRMDLSVSSWRKAPAQPKNWVRVP